MVLAVKCWMKNIDVTNVFFLIIKIYDVIANSNFNNKKILTQINKIKSYHSPFPQEAPIAMHSSGLNN